MGDTRQRERGASADAADLMQVTPGDDFRLSYAPADVAWAEWIAWQLRNASYTVLIEAWDIRPGHNLVVETDRAIRASRQTVAVLSPRYLAAVSTTSDWATALGDDPTGERRALIPVVVEACDPGGLLGQRVPIDLTGLRDEGAARAKLLDGIVPGPAKRPHTPIYPLAAPQPVFPGRAWNVPYAHHADRFVGRSELLEQLEMRLSDTATAIHQAVAGLGGVGKTQLAVEYAYRHRSRYEAVCWVRAGDRSSLVADYAALEDELGLPGTGSSHQQLALAEVRRWFEEHDSWLLIFDDAQAPESLIGAGPGFQTLRDFLPRPGRLDSGHVLITSRLQSWDAVATVVSVDVLKAQDAERFLLNQTESDDLEAAREVAEALGFLPLALEQARAYIQARDYTLRDYLNRLCENNPELFERGRPRDYEGTVASTWKVSIEAVRSTSPAAVMLLEVFAFLFHEDIPRDELVSDSVVKCAPELGLVTQTTLALDDAVAVLRQYSLIRRAATSGLSVHRLVQTVVRQSLSEGERQNRAAVALRLVELLFPRDVARTSNWALCDRLVGHAIASVLHAYDLRVEIARTVDLLERVFAYLFERGRYIEARTQADLFLRLIESAHGPDTSAYVRALMYVGDAHYELGDLGAAKGSMEAALAIGEHGAGLDPQTEVRLLSSLGLISMELAELERAKELQIRALTTAEAAEDSDDLIARAVSNLGVVYYELGERQNARACQERARDILKARTAGSHAHIVSRRLAVVLYDFGSFSAPKKALEDAVAFFDKTLGDHHPEVAKTLHHLASVMWDLGELDIARSYFERALAIFSDTYQRPHPAVARTLGGLAMVVQDQGHISEAIDLNERALVILEQLFGRNHAEVGRALDKLGFALRNAQRRVEARECMERAIAILNRTFGHAHPELAIPLTNLGLILQELGELDEARVRHDQAISIFDSLYDVDHAHRHLAYSRLAVVLQKQGDLPKARSLLEQAVQVFRQKKSGDHPDVGRAMEKLALVLEDMGETDAARVQFERSNAIFEQALGPDHPRSRVSASRLQEFNARL